MIKELIKDFQWKRYVAASVIVSIFALIIHVKYNSPPQFEVFFMWLPLVWLMVFLLAVFFMIFLEGKNS